MNLRIKNYELETFAYLLYEMKLGGKKSRMRTRLLKVLQNHLGDLKESHDALLSEYALHDEAGQVVYENREKTIFSLIPETSDEFHKEYNMLRNEEVIIEANEATQDMILTVAQSFLDEEVEINKNDAMIYDNICEQLEDILARYADREESH